MIADAIALDGQAAAVAFDNQVDSKRTYAPLWSNTIAGGNEALHDFALKGGLGALVLFFERAHEAAGILRVFDQLATKVVSLEVVVGTEGVDDPDLVEGGGGGGVEALLEQFLVGEGERAALRSVNQRDEDDVAFVALELGSVSAEEAVELVAVGREMRTEKIVNLDGLFIADQRNHAEAGGLSRIVFLIFRLLDRRGEEGGGGQGLLTIDLAVAARAGDAIGDRVRPEMDATGIAQGLGAVIVRNQVAELDDFRDATEIVDHARKRHHPDGNGAAAFRHFPGGFSAEERNAYAVSFADAANGVQPSDQRLALAGGSAAGLSGPGALVNQADGDAAKLFTKFFALGLERFEGNAGAAVEFIVELAPSPGRGGIAGRLSAAVDPGAITDRSCPRGSSSFELGEQGAAQIEVGLAALEFEEALVSFAVVVRILVLQGGEELGIDLGRFGNASG